MKILRVVLITVSIFLLGSQVSILAGIGTYDFENNANPPSGDSMFLSMENGSGYLRRATFGIVLTSAPAPNFGTLSLHPLNNSADIPYILNFSNVPVTGFSLDMGNTASENRTLSLKAYTGANGTGVLVANTTATLTNLTEFKRLSVQGVGIRSVVFIGGTAAAPNSVFYDNFKVTTVPNGTVFGETPDSSKFADLTVYRPSDGNWYSLFSHGLEPFYSIRRFGLGTDKPVPADYNGDGNSDVAVFRDGVWYIQLAISNQIQITQFGLSGDIPAPADYDNDGKSDIAVFRPSTGIWHIIYSSNGQYFSVRFGIDGDLPRPSNYDADGKADPAVFRPSNGVWYILKSSDGNAQVTAFGQSGDIPVPADYDGDGLTDVSVYRSGIWWTLQSSNGAVTARQFGLPGDIPVPADYPNFFEIGSPDGKAEQAVFRPATGTWYILTVGGVYIRNWGQNGDLPISLIP